MRTLVLLPSLVVDGLTAERGALIERPSGVRRQILGDNKLMDEGALLLKNGKDSLGSEAGDNV